MIGEEAYYGCTSLVEIINLSSLSLEAGEDVNGWIAYYALNITDEFSSGKFDVIDGFSFYILNGENYLISSLDNSSELCFPESYQGESYQIAPFAFCNLSVSFLQIPVAVTRIGSNAFSGCEWLHHIWYNVPDDVDIGMCMFISLGEDAKNWASNILKYDYANCNIDEAKKHRFETEELLKVVASIYDGDSHV